MEFPLRQNRPEVWVLFLARHHSHSEIPLHSKDTGGSWIKGTGVKTREPQHTALIESLHSSATWGHPPTAVNDWSLNEFLESQRCQQKTQKWWNTSQDRLIFVMCQRGWHYVVREAGACAINHCPSLTITALTHQDVFYVQVSRT